MHFKLFLIFLLVGQVSMAQTETISTKEKGDFIKFKIVNTSINTIHAYVRGPKKSGGHFSYGLNIAPFSPRKENWSIGTKLYQENKIGRRKLIYTFTAKDEGKTVNITPNKNIAN